LKVLGNSILPKAKNDIPEIENEFERILASFRRQSESAIIVRRY